MVCKEIKLALFSQSIRKELRDINKFSYFFYKLFIHFTTYILQPRELLFRTNVLNAACNSGDLIFSKATCTALGWYIHVIRGKPIK